MMFSMQAFNLLTLLQRAEITVLLSKHTLTFQSLMMNGQLEAFSTILILEDISIISLEKIFYLQKILITRKTQKKEKLIMRI